LAQAGTYEYAQKVGAKWWVWALIGVAAIAAGVIAIAYPDITVTVLGLAFGVFLLLYGLALIAAAFDPGVAAVHSTLRVILGVVALIAGLVVVVQPADNVKLLLVIIALWFIVAGATVILEGIVNREGRWLPKIVLGAVGIVAGILLLQNPDMGLDALALVAGISLVVWGVLEIAASFDIRRMRGA
jgi:uncharacterized membrane protein HdeD (DUF308 family)